MISTDLWDWEVRNRFLCDASDWRKRYPVVQEFTVSDDGERIAAVIEIEPQLIMPCINGKPWDDGYEKVWSLKFSPDSRLVCAVLKDYEWTVAIDNDLWQEKYDFVWNISFSPDGRDIAGNIKKDDAYGVALNGKSWLNTFPEARDLVISPNGRRTASRIKTKRLASLDTSTFAEKILTVAVDGEQWPAIF